MRYVSGRGAEAEAEADDDEEDEGGIFALALLKAGKVGATFALACGRRTFGCR